ncbi:speract receptor-like [Pollicipes pollicipes]|uniref:speract receptor-like n=1 Tax=Pollicipes pollicipes TaxID=41117 RepID=UPI001884C83F|nr:speract receptor-like [Pollicipes pollicipes]
MVTRFRVVFVAGRLGGEAVAGWGVTCCGPPPAGAELFLMGYLTGSQRSPGDQEYTRPGRAISGAMNLALHEIRQQRPLVHGHQLDFVVAETYGRESESLRQVVRLWNRNVSAYIGPQETCVHEGRLAASLNLPMISYFCTNFETSDKKLFPTFARTRPPDTQISKSVLSLLLRYSWMKVAFLYKDSPESELGAIGETIVSVLRRGGVSLRHVVTWNQTFHVGYMDNPFTDILRRTKDDVRIYVVLGEYYEHRAVLMTLQEQNLLQTGEYFVVGVDIQRYQNATPQKYLRTLFREESPTDPRAEQAFKYYVGVIGSPTIGFEVLTRLVNDFMELPPFNYTNILREYGGNMKIRSEAAYLYDAVHLYAWSLNETLKMGGDPRNGTAVIARLLGRSYFSAMGYMVYMDAHGDTEGNYTLIQRRRVGGAVGLHPAGVFQLRGNGTDLPELVIGTPIRWPHGQPPIDEPPCGFRGEYCISYTTEIASGIVGGIVLVLIIIGLVFYRNWQYEQELDSLLWKIDYKEIQMSDGMSDTKPLLGDSFSSKMVLRSSQVSLSSNCEMDFRYSALYTTVGIYKGRMVAIKDIKRKTIDITRRMKKELKKMRDLRHDNLNPFVGACVDPPHLCTVSDYCTRGSLRDILENSNVKLDNMFIASMVFDIVRGMGFLHDSPIRVHGNLKTTNCLVDSRWVVKVADFGLGEIMNRAEEHLETEKDVRQKCEDLLFKAPEVLRSSGVETGSQRADVYSFAMVLYEIHSRSPPFSGMGLGPLELLQSVIKRSSNNNPVFRPPIHMLETCFDCVRIVLSECWAEEPENRPDFKSIRNKLRPMRKGMKPHIFDNMISMMEKYTNNLEVLVDERTNQLIVEKKKTEALLHEMLPRYVADQLKRGNSVQAESFDSVTIYFSDIVGFTSMSAESTPLQVVDFLNDLYTCFDSIIDNYDVYKVETIGDAYMVVSGLPVRNGLQHAGEVASMSLHLLEAIRRFTIRHRPQDTLMLRIGIHTVF